MTIYQGDIKLLASAVMRDVPEGGGPPTSTVIPDGGENTIFPDKTEVGGAGGDVALRKVFPVVQTLNTEALMGVNVIIEAPPADERVAVTLMGGGTVFDRRTDAQNRLENYSVRGPEISGFLMENHVTNQRSIKVFQRPNTPLFQIGATLFLVYLEGQGGERQQAVRISRASYEEQQFTYQQNNQYDEYPARVALLEIDAPLRADYPGSAPSRFYTPEANKTKIRTSTAVDAGNYFSVSPLSAAATVGATQVQVQSIYTQLVPSGRTETPMVDQVPAGRPTLTLATAPRRIDITVPPHTQRIKIGDVNRGYAYTTMLRPLPARGTVTVEFQVFGNWYTLKDNGAGVLVAEGLATTTGTVDYVTGSVAVSLGDYPDLGSAMLFSWASAVQYVNRSGLATFRAPEYALQLEHAGIKPGTLTLQWTSGGVLKTAAANSAGGLTGDATGELNHASGKLFWRPLAMPDPGGEFSISYQWVEMVEKSVPGLVPDAGGFATIALDDVAAPGSIVVRWVTVRNVTASSGSSSGGTSADKSSVSTTTNIYYPPPPPAPAPAPGPAPAPSPNDAVFARPPVKTSRVGMSQAQISDWTSTNRSAGMYPLGKDASGKTVYVAVAASMGGGGGGGNEMGFGYDVPNGTGITWTAAELAAGQIVVGGVTYQTWSAYLGA